MYNRTLRLSKIKERIREAYSLDFKIKGYDIIFDKEEINRIKTYAKSLIPLYNKTEYNQALKQLATIFYDSPKILILISIKAVMDDIHVSDMINERFAREHSELIKRTIEENLARRRLLRSRK